MSKKNTTQALKVIELFAGVGGFHLGLKKAKGYEIVWSNQWEPGTKLQHASDIYKTRFPGTSHSNTDISKVTKADIPAHDLLVGGFPCQDYSVARTLNHAKGILGKKGVLWWQIHRIIEEKGDEKPSYLMLENVDRLLKSPVAQRGRDFALMLSSLSEQGYIVEWRVINAADYGMPQRRRRIFILAYQKNSPIYNRIHDLQNPFEWIINYGTIAKAFPVIIDKQSPFPKGHTFLVEKDLVHISEEFNLKGGDSPFENTGILIDNKVYSLDTKADYKDERTTLGDIIIKDEEKIPEEYFIDSKDKTRWAYLKGSKKEPRKSKSGHIYNYSEGAMAFPDPLNKPARTIITGEGGSSPSRFKHVIRTKSGKLRRLTPIELERINMFPDDHTSGPGITDNRRAFFMGNALVVGVVEELGKSLLQQVKAAVKAKKQLP
ncbi:MAG: DNA (cytosine-5-)-methyltransferase [Elusimicrobia bacterium GWA2_64_40]|nr:MAG: DNA (cytosine-5-)-methyltransferase [Elusimicrobia bacterium GWA2_64_40]